ncbi:DoxX family protein [Microbispora sp. NPDC046973]|uniref:DoxX family protein n=1 Tax=Microbispora sp. NPDC046973 TaxID=3155022 RepID=UPI0034078A26
MEPISSIRRCAHLRAAGYWTATAAVAAELAVGGIWDIARIPHVRDLVTHLGYPPYFLVLLGTWKVLGAIALLVPRRPLVKEWAYAGAFYTYTGAVVSHVTTGYSLGEVWVLAILTALTALSWALRPPGRVPASGCGVRDAGFSEPGRRSAGSGPTLGRTS